MRKVSHSLSNYERILILLFVVTLPLVNPWVRGDGIGYYAYIRSLLVDHDLRFENEWLQGNTSFLMGKVDATGHLRPEIFTSTGYVDNHFSVGPAILWAPFLVPVHLLTTALYAFGAGVAPDGYSWPYTVTMAVATAFYGFLGLFLAFRLSRTYLGERWAFWGTLGIWFASSLPVYMYLNPSWSHAHSAFAVSLFLWYWHRTRGVRKVSEWAFLGVLSGLMLNVYYLNAVLLLVPLLESLRTYGRSWQGEHRDWATLKRLFAGNLAYLVVTVLAFLPTLLTRQIIYGSPLGFGYQSPQGWLWTRPALWDVLFSSNHGLFAWTPVLVPAVLGLLFVWPYDRELATYLGITFVAFYYATASYPVWHGISSFGNRFFVSLSPVFVLGLSASFRASEKLARAKWVSFGVPAGVALLVVWNLGFIFQWGTKMITNRGPVSWSEVARNQFTAVPIKGLRTVEKYLLGRGALMQTLEREDVRQIQAQKTSKENGEN